MRSFLLGAPVDGAFNIPFAVERGAPPHPAFVPYISITNYAIDSGVNISENVCAVDWCYDSSITPGSNPMILGESPHWLAGTQDIVKDGQLSSYSNPIPVSGSIRYVCVWDKPNAQKRIYGGAYTGDVYGNIVSVRASANYALGSFWYGNTSDFIKVFGFKFYRDGTMVGDYRPITDGNGFTDALGVMPDITSPKWTYGEVPYDDYPPVEFEI